MSSSRFTLLALLTREAGVKWSVVYESRGTSKKFSVIVLPLEGTSRSTSANGFATSFNNNCVTTLAQTSAGRVNVGKFLATAPRHSTIVVGFCGGSTSATRGGSAIGAAFGCFSCSIHFVTAAFASSSDGYDLM